MSYSTAPSVTMQSKKKLQLESVDTEVKTSTRHYKVPPAPPVRHIDTKTDSPEASKAEQQSRIDSSEAKNDSEKESVSMPVAEASVETDSNNEVALLESDTTDGAETGNQMESGAETGMESKNEYKFTSTTTLENHSLDESDVRSIPISIGVSNSNYSKRYIHVMKRNYCVKLAILF